MNKKIALVFVIALICFAFPVLGFENVTGNITELDIINVDVAAGSVFEVDGMTYEFLGSDIGGIISSFQNVITKQLFSGSTLFHQEESIEVIPTFELLAFPVDSNPDINQLVYTGIFESSEPVIIEGKTTTEHIFITSNVDASWGDGPDTQTLSRFNEMMTTNGGNLIVVSINGNAEYKANGDSTILSKPIEACTEILCPTAQQIEVGFGLVYGIDYNEIRTFNNPFAIGRVLILELDNVLVGFLIDKNVDKVWDFTTNIAIGKSVTSFEGNTLLLIPPGIYDLYVIV